MAKSSEQSSEQSEDNSVDISRKDIDDHEPVVDESKRENRSTRKDVEKGLPSEKSKSHVKRKASFASEFAIQSIICIFMFYYILSNLSIVRRLGQFV